MRFLKSFAKYGGMTLAVIIFLVVYIDLSSAMKSEAQASYDAAGVAYKVGDFAKAEALTQQAAAVDATSAQVQTQLGALALLSNHPDKAITFYTAALQRLPWYERVWPLTADIKYHLGLAYYNRDDFVHAQQFFAEAAGPFQAGPLGDLKTVKGMSQQMALFGTTTPYVIDGPDTTRIPFVVTDPLPLVRVSINGSEPVYFFLDTGGAEVILDKKFAPEVRAQMAGDLTGEYAAQKTAEAGLGKIDLLSIAGLSVRNIPIQTLDIASTSALFEGRPIKGIIGTRFLMHFLSTIDYKKGELTLRRIDTQSLPDVPQGKKIPFSLFGMHMMMAQGTVNGHGPMLFFVDTGLAGSGFTATEPLLHEYGITVDWSKAKDSIGGAGAVKATELLVEHITLGSGENEVSKNKVLGVATEGGVPVVGDSLGFHVGGFISHAFFRQSAVTFDFTNMQLIVED